MCRVFSIGFSFLAQIPLWVNRGEKNPNKPAWIYKKNFIVFTKDHSYCHLQYQPLHPRAFLMPGPQLSFPNAGAHPHQETFTPIKRHLGLKRCIVWQGSHPVQHLRLSLQEPHIHVPSSLWSAVRAVALSWTKGKGRLEATGRHGHDLPGTEAVPISVCLEQQHN